MADTPVDPKDVALAALTNLLRLMGAELVAGRHRDDFGVFERAVRDKLASTSVAATTPEIAEAGLQLASRCIEQALANLRIQANEVRAAESKSAASPEQTGAPKLPKPKLN